MKEKVLELFAKLIANELDPANGSPYEGIVTRLENDYELVDCAMEGDKMVLQIRTEKGLRLQAMEWKR